MKTINARRVAVLLHSVNAEWTLIAPVQKYAWKSEIGSSAWKSYYLRILLCHRSILHWDQACHFNHPTSLLCRTDLVTTPVNHWNQLIHPHWSPLLRTHRHSLLQPLLWCLLSIQPLLQYPPIDQASHHNHRINLQVMVHMRLLFQLIMRHGNGMIDHLWPSLATLTLARLIESTLPSFKLMKMVTYGE